MPRSFDHPAGSGQDAAEVHRLFMDLARLAGLLQPDQPDSAHPVSVSQAFALHELRSESALSQQELAARLRLEKSSVSRLAADLESDGLIERIRDPNNYRQYRLRLTEGGRLLQQSMAHNFDRRYERWTEAMTPAELANLLSGLQALVRVVRAES
jgi:DNA-binding MarR family transcriptional regulator